MLATLAAVSPYCDASPAFFDAELSYAHEDNVGHAAWRADRLDDDVVTAGVSANQLTPVSRDSGLLLSGRAEYRRYTAWEALSHVELGAALVYRVKPQPAFDAVWYELTAAGRVRQYEDSRIRDGGEVHFGAALGSNLTDRVQVRAGYRYALERAWNGSVFDGARHRLFTDAQWHAGAITAYGSFAWQRGDVVSTTYKAPGYKQMARAYAADDALWSPGRPRTAYRLEADTVSGTAGINYALGGGLALDVSARYFDAETHGGTHYDGYGVRAGILYRF